MPNVKADTTKPMPYPGVTQTIKMLRLDTPKGTRGTPRYTLLGEVNVLWPPPAGVPDVLIVAQRTFVRKGDSEREYVEASVFGITGYDFPGTDHWVSKGVQP